MLGKNETKTNVFQLCCGQRDYVGYVVWKNIESYVEMVAGLPRNEQKNEYFVNQTKDRTKDRTKNDYFVNQTKDRMASRTHKTTLNQIAML